MKYTTKDITFVMPSYNTLAYTMMAYRSLREFYPNNEIIVLDDGSTDGTEDYFFGSKSDRAGFIKGQTAHDDNLRAWKNETGNILGHTITYDMGIKMAKNPLVTIFHSDMICCKNYLENMLKHWQPKTVVCATRIEPEGIYPPGKEKILKPFGIYHHEFKKDELTAFVAQEQIDSKDKTTRGIFAPWLISKEDFLAIGGHDAKSFAPYPEEDADLFLRWHRVGYNLIQSRDSLCWHWISRGHRSWAKNGVGKDDSMFKFYQDRARRNYIRKWHSWMKFDEWHHPIPVKVFDVAFVLRDVDSVDFLHFVEPWASKIYVNPEGWDKAEEYIKREQISTKINLSERVVKHTGPTIPLGHAVVLEFSQKDFMSSNGNEAAGIIMSLTDMLSELMHEQDINNSQFELGIFKLTTGEVKDISHTLIKV